MSHHFAVGGSGVGGGGSDNCVCPSMFIGDGWQARDAHEMRGPLYVMNDDLVCHTSLIESVEERVLAPCYRITMKGGAVWEGSESTPLVTGRGPHTYPGSLRTGEQLNCRYDGVDMWDEVSAVESIGIRLVVPIHIWQLSYAAGREARAMVYTHNPAKP